MYRNSVLLNYYSIELARAFRLSANSLRLGFDSCLQRLPRVEIAPRCIKIRMYFWGRIIWRCETWEMIARALMRFFFFGKGFRPRIPRSNSRVPHFANSPSPGYASSSVTFFESLVCLRHSPWHRLRLESSTFFRANIMCREYFQSIPLCLLYHFSRREFSSDISNSCVNFFSLSGRLCQSNKRSVPLRFW